MCDGGFMFVEILDILSSMEKQWPRVCVGVIVLNPNGELRLLRSRKWKNRWVVPGGAVEWGETFAAAGKREVLEETGLSISGIKCIGVQEAVFPKNFHKKRHFVFIDLVARTKGERVVLNHEENQYLWLPPGKALRKPLGGGTRKFMHMWLNETTAKRNPRAGGPRR